MKDVPIARLVEILRAEVKGSAAGSFSGVCTDSRQIQGGQCFFGLRGENYDGGKFIGEVFEKSAACAVIDKNSAAGDFGDKAVLRVADSLKALGELARWYRTDCGFRVVGITGSVGKTTTRQMIYHVLSVGRKVCQSEKNFNNYIGLPLTILSAEGDTEIVVAEMGSSGYGEIGYLTGIARPDVAAVTNVYPAHLEGFGNIETIAKEKVSISRGLRENGVFIINGDCPILVETCRKQGLGYRTFSRSGSGDFTAKDIRREAGGSRFLVSGVEIFVPLAGNGNIENALAAYAVCSYFGVSGGEFVEAMKSLTSVAMRAELVKAGAIIILNDCYNANPASMRNALEILGGLTPERKGRRVFICGDMAELGKESAELHKKLGEDIAEAKVELLIAVGKYAEVTADAAKASAKYKIEIKCFQDCNSMCNKLENFINVDDIVLAKGSRVNHLEKAVERLTEIGNRFKNHED